MNLKRKICLYLETEEVQSYAPLLRIKIPCSCDTLKSRGQRIIDRMNFKHYNVNSKNNNLNLHIL